MSDDLKVLNFNKVNIPLPLEPNFHSANDDTFIHWGMDNLYPNYLLKLYGESPIHQAIINNKVTYLIGDGFKYADGNLIKQKVNAVDTLEQFLNKIVKDYLLFGFFTVEVVYNAFMQPIEYHHVPVHKIRMNKSKTKFWFNDDWLFRKVGSKVFERWSEKPIDSTSKIFLYEGYVPTIKQVYPAPSYEACIKSISTDAAIIDFNLNNIKNNFSVSSLITFFMGENVTNEVKQATKKHINDTFAGETGSKIMLDFQAQNGKGADIQQLGDNQWADAYLQLQDNVTDSILRGHGVTSPALMGVRVAGQWQNSSGAEMETSYEIFKNTFVSVTRAELLAGINLLFTKSTIITGELLCTDKALFQTSLSDTLVQAVYTIDEIRKLAGLPPLPNGDGAKLLAQNTNSVTPVNHSAIVEDVKKKPTKVELSEDDFEKIKHLGTAFEEFDLVDDADKYKHIKLNFDKVSDIAKWVLDNDIKGLTIDEINKELYIDTAISIPSSELKSIFDELQTSGIIKVDTSATGRINIMPSTKADISNTRKIETLYMYEVRSGLGNPIIPNTRSFCRKLIENNRLYTREEIQEMSAIFGYDVFTYCGGFYHNPETEETTSYCRHKFVQKVVTRKIK